MKTYLIDDYTKSGSLMELQFIEGCSPIDALRTHLNGVKIRRARNDEKRCADYILQECVVRDGKPYLRAGCGMLCYVRA